MRSPDDVISLLRLTKTGSLNQNREERRALEFILGFYSPSLRKLVATGTHVSNEGRKVVCLSNYEINLSNDGLKVSAFYCRGVCTSVDNSVYPPVQTSAGLIEVHAWLVGVRSSARVSNTRFCDRDTGSSMLAICLPLPITLC